MFYKTELMEKILTSPKAQQIIDYVTPKYGAAYVCLWIFQSIGTVLDEGSDYIEEFIKQIVPQTATWSIPYWEKSYGIVPDPNWTQQQRRENIIGRMNQHSPMNPRIMEQRISSILGYETKIYEFAGKNKIEIYVYGNTTEQQLVIDFIEKAKPAHIIYDLQFADKVDAALNEYYKVSATFMEVISVNVIDENSI